jgi:hypothetical protein
VWEEATSLFKNEGNLKFKILQDLDTTSQKEQTVRFSIKRLKSKFHSHKVLSALIQRIRRASSEVHRRLQPTLNLSRV